MKPSTPSLLHRSRSHPRSRREFDGFWIVLLVIPPVLIFPNLGAAILWQDEAETANLARRIARYGVPLADDGRPPLDPFGHSLHAVTDQRTDPENDHAYRDINEEGIWIWTSWFANYLTAGSILAFQELGLFDRSMEWRTFAARFPFAMVGWLLFFVMYAGLRDITRHRSLSRLAVMMLMFSVPYLLFTRQCRAYTMLATFNFMQTWGYVRMTRRHARGTLLFILGGVGGFYSFFPAMVGVTGALGGHLFLKHRRQLLGWRFLTFQVATRLTATRRREGLLAFFKAIPRFMVASGSGWARWGAPRRLWARRSPDRWRVWSKFLAGCFIIALLTAPFFIYTRSWDRNYEGSGVPIFEDPFPWRFAASLRAYLFHVHMSAWPFVLALPLAVGALRGWFQRRGAPWVGLLVGLIVLPPLWILFYGMLTAPAGATSFSVLLGMFLLVLAWLGAWMALSGWKSRARFDWDADWKQVMGGVLAAQVFVAAALANHPFFRYLLGAVPLTALAGAACVLFLTRDKPWFNVPLTVLVLGCEVFQYGPIYIAREVVFDPWYEARVAHHEKHDRFKDPYELSYFDATKFGHLGSNGYSWTMMYKNGRWENEEKIYEVSVPLFDYEIRWESRTGRDELEFPLFNYYTELTHDYEGPIERVIRHLQRHAAPDDVVATVYEHFPLKFYTDLTVLRTWELGHRAPNRYPDWIIAQHPQYKPRLPQAVYRQVRDGQWYERIRLPDDPCALMWDNIPEPPWHFFKTVRKRLPYLQMWGLRPEAKSAGRYSLRAQGPSRGATPTTP